MDQDKKNKLKYIKEHIRNIPDFPKPGIQFKDITTLLKDANALQFTSDLLKHAFTDEEVDQVVGLESRGFLFGPRLAQDLQAGFIPIRKPGKLPAKTLEARYELEYGEDTIEIHADAIEPGDKIIIHDDLVATGGSAKAATSLVKKLGGRVIGYSFIIALEGLDGTQKLPDDAMIDILVTL